MLSALAMADWTGVNMSWLGGLSVALVSLIVSCAPVADTTPEADDKVEVTLLVTGTARQAVVSYPTTSYGDYHSHTVSVPWKHVLQAFQDDVVLWSASPHGAGSLTCYTAVDAAIVDEDDFCDVIIRMDVARSIGRTLADIPDAENASSGVASPEPIEAEVGTRPACNRTVCIWVEDCFKNPDEPTRVRFFLRVSNADFEAYRLEFTMVVRPEGSLEPATRRLHWNLTGAREDQWGGWEVVGSRMAGPWVEVPAGARHGQCSVKAAVAVAS
jgi:hypothetical protein